MAEQMAERMYGSSGWAQCSCAMRTASSASPHALHSEIMAVQAAVFSRPPPAWNSRTSAWAWPYPFPSRAHAVNSALRT